MFPFRFRGWAIDTPSLKMYLNGRKKIYTTANEITAENVISEVSKAIQAHSQNVIDEDYLYWYRRGIQPILSREKVHNSYINNKVVCNFADQIVTFKNGYFLTKPVFYIGRNNADNEKVKQLNNFLYTSGKHQADNEVANSFHTMGVGVLYVKPNKHEDEKEYMPVKVYSLDPQSAFVVYSYKPGKKPVMGINTVLVDGNQLVFDVFTEDLVFKLIGSYGTDDTAQGSPNQIVSIEPNVIGKIPIIEYFANENRMASFECAMSLMDDYNLIESNRADSIEQFIQSVIVVTNADFDEDVTAETIKEKGMVCLKSVGESKADIKVIAEQLDQSQTQTTLDSIENQILAKCGCPSSVSTGASFENVGAAYMDRGYAIADTYNRNTEDCYRKSNALFTDIFLTILKQSLNFEIRKSDIDVQFTAPELDNMLIRTQAAMNLKSLGVSPELTLAKTGLSADPINDVQDSMPYIKMAWEQNKVETTRTPQVQPSSEVNEEENEQNT